MPSLHLLRSSYDGLVYDFPCDLGGIVGGYGLRFLCLHYLRRSHRDCAMIVRISYDLTISVRCFFAPLLQKKSYARCMISARPPHNDPALVYDATYDVFLGLRSWVSIPGGDGGIYPPPPQYFRWGGDGLYYHPPQYFTVECHIIPTK